MTNNKVFEKLREAVEDAADVFDNIILTKNEEIEELQKDNLILKDKIDDLKEEIYELQQELKANKKDYEDLLNSIEN